jgi:hypothetical protein
MTEGAMGADMEYTVSACNTYTLHSSTVLEFTGATPSLTLSLPSPDPLVSAL